MSALPQNAGPIAAREFTMSNEEFRVIGELVGKLAGIVINEQKRPMVYARLSRRLRALEMDDFTAYINYVASGNCGDEVTQFINAVTTNLTSFFREGHHFEHLGDVILPELAATRPSRTRVWCAAASSGEEPYSIAMTIAGSPHRRSLGDFKMLATDLDTNMLDRCRAGEYLEKQVQTVPQKHKSYLKKQGPDSYVAAEELKSMVSFKQLNLIEPWPVRGPFDIIFCRNVLIYFDDATKRRLVDQFVNLLTPAGVLYLGHSESLLGAHPGLTSEGRTIYRRKQ